ncbi:MAG: L-aspartate oxidase [Clostridia bacterium]|nr:L-aspartate oxidase [Clostridia bacterium]
MKIKTDILIVGTGAAGLYCALNLPEDKDVLLITKATVEESDSFLAQGGICMLRDEADYEPYFEDTLRAGHYENRRESVEIMIRSSQDIINDLINYGVDFERDEDGSLKFTKEGAHSAPRICFHEDITGKEITSKLLAAVRQRSNLHIIENMKMVDILTYEERCIGIAAEGGDGKMYEISARFTILATGGIGGLYHNSTNYPHLTADALAIAMKHKIVLENIDYVQIHPTTLYSPRKGRRFLISESVRGEGAILLNARLERFTDELQPRDVVSKALWKQMYEDDKPYVWLSMENIPKDDILAHFPNIYRHCLEEGYDVTKECIPVVPAQHYFMGGIHVDKHSKTSMDNLYAAGETSCNGVHGKNRLASNSLLESLVFAKRAAKRIALEYNDYEDIAPDVDIEAYRGCDKDYIKIVRSEIERLELMHK